MSTTPICKCDAANSTLILNLPGLTELAFRAGDFNSFRQALLTPLLAPPGQSPLEQSLTAWQTDGADPSVADLGVMMVEWWAYLCDILTFYNERIANEDYLRTALLPETPAELIRILGYRPRPAIGATGTLAALIASSILPGQTVTLPKGLQFQSKPGPGGAPQTFELMQATTIGLPDRVPAIPPPNLIADLGSIPWEMLSLGTSGFEVEILSGKKSKKVSHQALQHQAVQHQAQELQSSSVPQYGILLKGSVTSLSSGDVLLLGQRSATTAPLAITLSQPPAVQAAQGGGKQTLLSFISDTAPAAMTAATSRLTKPNQNSPLWTVNGSPYNSAGSVIQMASLLRQIRPNDYIVFSAPGADPQLVQVQSATDVMGDACTEGGPTTVSAGGTGHPTPIPVLHTQLTLNTGISSWLNDVANAAVSVLHGWVEVGALIDQPPGPWTGTGSLQAVQPAQFPSAGTQQILLADSDGNGDAASGVGNGATLSVNWPTSTPIPLSPALQPPLHVYYNLLAVSRGKTVANEVLGSGDATQAGQSFKLAKSPVTYLANPSTGYASTITVTVNGEPWKEVQSFYGQAANARVFVTREDSNQNTWIDFGDGVNGARLTTGSNNVVATYRIGAGASSPPAGKLTVVAQSYPGLKSVVNPVAVSGGSDPDPAALLKEYAPRSVLAFNRAVSVFDYEALAAQAPGVTMATASWSWDAVNLRAAVTVYVAGEDNVATSVQSLLAAEGDPNRPVTVLPAKPLPVTLTMAFVVVAGMDETAIKTNLTAALCDPITGLFSPPQIGIGQSLFDSMIEAACLTVDGVLGIQSSVFAVNGVADSGPLHSPGEGAWFSLDASGFFPTTEASGND